MTSATTGHGTCRRGNSVWPSTRLTMARAMRSRARIPRRRRASRSRSGGSALARGPVVGGPLKGLFNARMSPRGVIQPPALFLRWPSVTAFAPATPVLPSSSAVVSNYGISRFHDILDVLHHDDHFVSIARDPDQGGGTGRDRDAASYSGHVRERPRAPDHQHHPHARDGRGAGGEIGTPRDADGDGSGRLLSVAGVPALRSRRSHLAQPRSVRALDGPRLDAALFDARARGSEGGERQVRAAGPARPDARRHQALPSARQ